MLTVTQLAKQFGISRTSVLYYEREGLLLPANRSDNGYRWYGEKEQQRLQSILAYRSFGVPVSRLSTLLDGGSEEEQQSILRDQFNALEKEIQSLRLQQKAIVQFMEAPELDKPVMTIDSWSDLMRASGMDDEDMHQWHKNFEAMEPEGHQRFLESLSIEPENIKAIRDWSR